MIQFEARSGEWKGWMKVGSFVLVPLLAYEAIGSWWNHSVRAFTLLAEIPSPSGQYKAVLFTQDCGQLCDEENDVSILRSDETADADAGRVFRSFDESTSAPRIPVPGTTFIYPDWTTVKWRGDDHLVVAYDRRAKVAESIRATNVGLPFFGRRIHVDYVGR